jgi:hypothetical protein
MHPIKNLLRICILTTLFLPLQLKAQSDQTAQPTQTAQTTIEHSGKGNHNELKLNMAYLIAGIFEASYEYNINAESSFGFSGYFNIEEGASDYVWGVMPFYRLYFGNNNAFAKGFFVELNANIGVQENYDYYYYDVYPPSGGYAEDEDIFSFGLGLGVGGKWMTSSNWGVEVLAGLGRSFINTDQLYSPIYPRLGISLLKRF